MDVKEVQKKRDELEKAIFNLVSTFQKDTDVTVSTIDLQTVNNLGKRNSELVGIKVVTYIN